MNESFADLKAVGDLQTSKDYMPFFRKLKENTIKGYTYSSVFGGNTANSEFEFMTEIHLHSCRIILFHISFSCEVKQRV